MSTSTPPEPAQVRVGDTLEVEVDRLAAGGHCVARHDGRVIFVRGVIPGELARVRVTEVTSRLARAEAVEIVQASPLRVLPACGNAGECGGCDFQHIDPAAQRRLKGQVLADQLQRIGGIAWEGEIEQVEPVLGSRTRMRFVAGPDGRLGLRSHRSHRIVPLPPDGCPIAHPAMPTEGPFTPGEHVGVVSADGQAIISPDDSSVVTEVVDGREFRVAGNGFWQAHRAAPQVLTAAVLAALDPQPGERALDLYCGSGLFSLALHAAGCRVTGIDGSKQAIGNARRNVPGGVFHVGDVARALGKVGSVDLVVLDPPRAGAGAAVVRQIARRAPRRIAYVSCDPATLARDLRVAVDEGLELRSVRAFELFGMTQHAECLAELGSR